MSRVLTRLAAILVAVGLLFTSQSLTTAQQAAAADPGYLMVHFTGEGAANQQMYLSHSADGVHWNDLNGGAVVLRSTIGTKGVRDPALVRSPDGSKYWIIATDLCISCGQDWNAAINNGSRNLVVWESSDLVSWSDPWLLNVAGAIPDGRNAWAPEAIWNPATNDYVLYWATNVPLNGKTKHRIYYARTSDFRTVGTPQTYIERPGAQEIIDTQIIEMPSGVGNYRYVRASGDGQITLEGSNSILGTWTDLGNLSGIGLTGAMVEGPMWMKFNGQNKWGLYLDQYAAGRGYMPVLTTDPSNPASYQTQAAGSYAMGGTKKRHGWILNLTAAEESRVLARWPSTPAQRLQSFNFQDRYVRQSDFDVRIDPDVSPADDAQFRMRPGLAGTGTVSFESVRFPGYFLRHANYDFQLVRHDGSAQFAADATFRKVAGLADPAWSSFQSYNYPDRYLRHYAYQLRLDPVTTATGRSDATFRLTN
ncbi:MULTISPECIES: glycoside hydrolase family 43 protein [Streptomyces]|uniref:glycoside hydrolase family 43 protein n=1 Tax=Streptomyces scabiei TaxID=1930 RepID=UPI0004E6B587|nr:MULTISPECIES: glycoside hydrolase family 43 protein [Streptomyces]KFG08979.1 1,4-beta-xylanase [Streptomyces scabiei]MBP5890330.1 1,4-beta-xylanase [Streptomyces sp. LBUM 1481]MBP5920363.1 1,4-beta-xylanase [Streptomyces sp. LBUM 1483]MDX2687780.1 glycoside hydrolase family 43 protein [Streptomyces scabiei]MDX2751149.1 glycoside hydrolase family 43 protein [Streptomyces scabiei]